jgi:hypothetical protein
VEGSLVPGCQGSRKGEVIHETCEAAASERVSGLDRTPRGQGTGDGEDPSRDDSSDHRSHVRFALGIPLWSGATGFLEVDERRVTRRPPLDGPSGTGRQ